jgi:hypothetical protein
MRNAFKAVLVTFVAAAVSVLSPAAASEPTVVNIAAVGTAFRVTLSDGTIRQGAELAGAVLVFNINGVPLRVRIAAVTPDPKDKTGSVLLHDFRVEPTGRPLCGPDPDGKRLGFPLAGRTGADGRLIETKPDLFDLVCTSGVQGKCVRFGYHPWRTTADARPLRAYFDACTRLMRADYCGDGRPWTRTGTSVDVWDDLGMQKSETGDDARYSFEAGWSPAGAVCVARTRIPENITLDKLKEYCPRLAVAAKCDAASARAGGALLFNRSR